MGSPSSMTDLHAHNVILEIAIDASGAQHPLITQWTTIFLRLLSALDTP